MKISTKIKFCKFFIHPSKMFTRHKIMTNTFLKLLNMEENVCYGTFASWLTIGLHVSYNLWEPKSLQSCFKICCTYIINVQHTVTFFIEILWSNICIKMCRKLYLLRWVINVNFDTLLKEPHVVLSCRFWASNNGIIIMC